MHLHQSFIDSLLRANKNLQELEELIQEQGVMERRNSYAVKAGQRIKRRRADLKMTQEALSKATGGTLSATRIANYEQGTRELGIQGAEILASALQTTPCYLLGLTPLHEYVSPKDYEVIRSLHALPEKDRQEYEQRIHALALAYRRPVPDERTGRMRAIRQAKERQTP